MSNLLIVADRAIKKKLIFENISKFKNIRAIYVWSICPAVCGHVQKFCKHFNIEFHELHKEFLNTTPLSKECYDPVDVYTKSKLGIYTFAPLTYMVVKKSSDPDAEDFVWNKKKLKKITTQWKRKDRDNFIFCRDYDSIVYFNKEEDDSKMPTFLNDKKFTEIIDHIPKMEFAM